jgi:hypothetical protein
MGKYSSKLLVDCRGLDYPRDTLWLFNIAMENGPFIDGLPGFTWYRWPISSEFTY